MLKHAGGLMRLKSVQRLSLFFSLGKGFLNKKLRSGIRDAGLAVSNWLKEAR